MKRFMLFAGREYSTLGGMEDFIGDFQALECARDRLVEWLECEDAQDPFFHIDGVCAHIYDIETMEKVYEL